MLLVISICLLFGWFCSTLASKKGRDPTAWFVLGFAFGILALAAVWFLPSLEGESKKSSSTFNVTPLEPEPQTDVQWYYLNPAHEQIGPLPLQEIRELLHMGKIDKTTYLWRPGMNAWTHAAELRSQIENFEIDKK